MKKDLKVVAIIPSRMGSTRFPGKPLAKILGLSMIEHVRRRVEAFEFLDEVFVATCDDEIKQEVERYGGKVIMTSDVHERCTDRIEEAAKGLDADVIVNVQGDEPMISKKAVEDVISPFFEKDDVDSSCIIYPIKDLKELTSLNIVKATMSRSGKVLYFSRSAIPGKEIQSNTPYYKQSGIMAYKKDFLHKFSQLESTPLEQKESVDMLRILEHDYSICGMVCDEETKGVDIPEQVGMIEDLINASSKEKEIFESIMRR